MKLKLITPKIIALVSVILVLLISSLALAYGRQKFEQQKGAVEQKLKDANAQNEQATAQISQLLNEDQRQVNQDLKKEIGDIKNAFKKAVAVYEDLLDFTDHGGKAGKLDDAWAQILSLLAKEDYLGAEKNLATLSAQIKTENEKLVASFKIPENTPVNNVPPGSGYSRQQVQTDSGSFLVSLVAADLNSTKVIVDTASESDCANNCPVLPLADYVARNGAFAGVNGSYFCPTEYPQCAGKTNSFDTLLMNKNKVYFNSGNNVYSTVPAAIFGGNWARFVGQSLEWGRTTDVDAVIANRPLLIMGGEIKFTGVGETKEGNKGGRSFIANKGSTVYIGVVHAATVAESAKALKVLGLENALNLDDGGSTALWSGGYKVGPGRNIPNAVLLVRK